MTVSLVFRVGLLLATVLSVQAAWDFMLFQQQWAPGVCAGQVSRLSEGLLLQQKPLTGLHVDCVIPANTTQAFTIHGSWPNKLGQKGPNYCNDSWPFTVEPIQDLLVDMDKFWPSLFGSNTAFWSHEWVKHGVCAATLAELNSEHKYFSFVLNLRRQHDFSQYLSSAGITPSDSTGYQLEDMQNAVKQAIGVTPLLTCLTSQSHAGQFLSGAAICISRNLQVIQCDESVFQETEQCVSGSPIIYKPFSS